MHIDTPRREYAPSCSHDQRHSRPDESTSHRAATTSGTLAPTRVRRIVQPRPAALSPRREYAPSCSHDQGHSRPLLAVAGDGKFAPCGSPFPRCPPPDRRPGDGVMTRSIPALRTSESWRAHTRAAVACPSPHMARTRFASDRMHNSIPAFQLRAEYERAPRLTFPSPPRVRTRVASERRHNSGPVCSASSSYEELWVRQHAARFVIVGGGAAAAGWSPARRRRVEPPRAAAAGRALVRRRRVRRQRGGGG